MLHIKHKKAKLPIMMALVVMLLSSCGAENQGTENTPAGDETATVTELQNTTGTTGFDWSSIGEIASVSAGSGYSLLLNADHELYSWGSNTDYVLGRYGVVTLTPEILLDDIIDMSAGSSHAGAIKSDHSLWLWGKNAYHQLGKTAADYSAEPIQVMKDVQDIICADSFSVVLSQDGTVRTFGRNHLGQLGIGSTEDTAEPAEVLNNVTEIAAGESFVMALKSDGTVWGWGISHYGQMLGHTDSSVEVMGQQIQIQSTPVKLMENIQDISCGAFHAMALDREGKLYTWGTNSSAQLGNNAEGTWIDKNYGGRELYSTEPNLIMTDVRYIMGGGYNSAAIKTDDSLWVWGNNRNFQIGDGTSSAAAVPVHVMENALSVSMSNTHVMALTKDHSYYAWGSNSNNILGDDHPTEIYEPIKIMDNVKSASIYNDHTLAVTNNNALYSFGDNSMGQLATGDFLNTSVPTLVMKDVVKAAAGSQHSICLKTDGSVWTWGSNTFGQLGNGHAEDVYSVFDVWSGGHPVWADASGEETDAVNPTAYMPAQILNNAVDIYAKWHTSYAVVSDGNLYGWGWNELYQLGNDTRNSSASPISMIDQAKLLIPSYALIKDDHTMWTWGSNSKDPYNLLPVEALDRVQSAAVADRMFFAVKEDSTLWVWGQSVPGELINSTEYNDKVEDPMQIGTNVKRVFANDGNVFVIDADDTLWALDTNEIVVRDAGTEDSDVFTYSKEYMVTEDVSDVFIGLESVLILKKDAALWGFGSNDYGQLGNGKRHFTPQKINN